MRNGLHESACVRLGLNPFRGSIELILTFIQHYPSPVPLDKEGTVFPLGNTEFFFLVQRR